jgi:hypothetical protein
MVTQHNRSPDLVPLNNHRQMDHPPLARALTCDADRPLRISLPTGGQMREVGQRSQWVVEPLRPQCTRHRPLAYLGSVNGGFGDISRSESTHSGQTTFSKPVSQPNPDFSN